MRKIKDCWEKREVPNQTLDYSFYTSYSFVRLRIGKSGDLRCDLNDDEIDFASFLRGKRISKIKP